MALDPENPFAPPKSPLAEPGPEPIDDRPAPFEDRAAEPRFWARVWAMFRMLFTEPAVLAGRIPNTSGLSAPLRFALLLSTPLMGLYLTIGGAVGLIVGLAAPASSADPFPSWLAAFIGPFYALLVALAVVLGLFLGGPVLHAFLWMWGGLRATRGMGQTLRAVGYYLAFHMLGSCIPLLNFAVALAGPAFLGMALARIHRTEAWRGICAAYTPALLCCCLYGGIFIAAFALK